MRHILTSQQFDRECLERLFVDTHRMHVALERGSVSDYRLLRYQEKSLFSVFYEPSTRTRFSFEAAAVRLGMSVVSTENAREFSSTAKGETLEDTIKVLCGYRPSMIVLRHFQTGAAARAARVSSVPIINAGDGAGQHPTQATLDIFTIQKEKGCIDGITVAIGGDLAHGRTARSLAYLLGKFNGVHLIFIAPRRLRMGDDIKEYLIRHKVCFEEADRPFPALRKADVVYWTRPQRERMTFTRRLLMRTSAFRLGVKELERLPSDTIILHPLPRTGELPSEIDKDPRAAYFRQAAYGLPLRMALISWVMDGGY